MSEVNVASKTQKIIVDPVSRSVSVINAGPMGPAGPTGGLTLQEARADLINSILAGTNVIITQDIPSNTITVSSVGSGASGLTLEDVRDDLASVLVAGPNITITHDDLANTITIAASGTVTGGITLEDVRDDLASVLVAGPNITITHDDFNNTITISASDSSAVVGGYTHVQPESDGAPLSATVDDTWFAPDTGFTYLYYDPGPGYPLVWLQSGSATGSISTSSSGEVSTEQLNEAVSTLKSTVYGLVNHGATAGTARPTGFAGIIWYGSVQPTNMQVPDFVIRTDEAV